MGRILPALLSLFVLIAVTEGDIVLCKHDTKITPHGEQKDIKFRSNDESDEELDMTSDNGLDEDYGISKTESLKQKLLEESLTEIENEEAMVEAEETSNTPSDY